MDIELKSLLKKKVSKKGTEYYCIETQLTPTYIMTSFPTKAEVELISNNYGVKNTTINNSNESNVFDNFK